MLHQSGPSMTVPKTIITFVISTHFNQRFRRPTEDQMSLDALMETLPSYAKDLKLNFSTVVRQQTDLTDTAIVGNCGGLRHGLPQ